MQAARPPIEMHPDTARTIARLYLPSRWHYHYSRSKLGSDPLYDGVCAALAGSRAPVLDLGCGIGLLAHCLRAQSLQLSYFGVDSDAGKIARAVTAGKLLPDARFAVVDLVREFPAHQGSVLLLDVLQYLPQAAQTTLLERACAALAPDARLVIRSGLEDHSWRSHLTHAADWFGRAVRWMNTAPKRYPSRTMLQQTFARHGVQADFQPLWGNTPFNNWLIVGQLQSAAVGNTVR